jgi:hypothetical protein
MIHIAHMLAVLGEAVIALIITRAANCTQAGRGPVLLRPLWPSCVCNSESTNAIVRPTAQVQSINQLQKTDEEEHHC